MTSASEPEDQESVPEDGAPAAPADPRPPFRADPGPRTSRPPVQGLRSDTPERLAGPGPNGIGHLPTILRRRLWLILGLWTLVGGLLVLGHPLLPQRASAVALIGVGTNETGPSGLSDENRLVDLTPISLAQLVHTPRTRARLAEHLGARGASMIETSRLEASVVPGGKVIQVLCRNADPFTAAQVANALAEALLERNREFLQAQAKEVTARLEDRLARERRSLDELDGRLVALQQRYACNDIGEELKKAQREAEAVRRRLMRAEDDHYRWLLEQRRDAGRAPPAAAAPSVPETEDAATVLAKLLERRAELMLIYRDRHPSIRLIDQQIELVRTRIAQGEREASVQDAAPQESSSPAETLPVADDLEYLRDLEARWAERTDGLASALPDACRIEVEAKTVRTRMALLERQVAGLERIIAAPIGQFTVLERAEDLPRKVPVLPPVVLGLVGAIACVTLAGGVVAVDLVRKKVLTAGDVEAAVRVHACSERDQGGTDGGERARAFFDRLVQSARSHASGRNVVIVVGVGPEDGARRIWYQIVLACRRMGYQCRVLDLESAESSRGVQDLVRHHEWCAEASSRTGTVLLPALRSQTATPAFLWGDEIVIAALEEGRYSAKELAFWLDTLPGGRRAVTQCVLTRPQATTDSRRVASQEGEE